MNNKNIAFLFDMDGVLIDTEPLYGKFWGSIAQRYDIANTDFVINVKGRTLSDIITTFLSDLSHETISHIVQELELFEGNVEFPHILGAFEFVQKAKDAGIKTALITSSSQLKLNRVLQQKQIGNLFDTIVSAKDIANSKPAPDCFLLGAERLAVTPNNCFVFEDSYAGIAAGNSADMNVVGVASTISVEQLRTRCMAVIEDFRCLSIDKIIKR